MKLKNLKISIEHSNIQNKECNVQLYSIGNLHAKKLCNFINAI